MQYRLIGVFGVDAAQPHVAASARWCEKVLNALDSSLVRFDPEYRCVLGTITVEADMQDDAELRDVLKSVGNRLRAEYGSPIRRLEVERCC